MTPPKLTQEILDVNENGIIENHEQSPLVDVFYVYPTAYFGFRWNAPLGKQWFEDWWGFVGDSIADSMAMVHASVFNEIGRVFIPRYRQVPGVAFMGDMQSENWNTSMDVAIKDVEEAYEAFLRRRGDSNRPIVVAGHSQGSMVLCRLLKKKYKTPEQAKNLVAAYLIAANLHDGDCGPMVKVCTHATDTTCFVHYNIFETLGGDHTKFILGAPDRMVCVNPLTWRNDDVYAGADENPGSRPILRVSGILLGLYNRFVVKSSALLNFQSQLEPGLFSAQCKNGVLWTNPAVVSGFWTTGIFPGKNLHGAESSIFFLSTRRNFKQRVKAFISRLSSSV